MLCMGETRLSTTYMNANDVFFLKNTDALMVLIDQKIKNKGNTIKC